MNKRFYLLCCFVALFSWSASSAEWKATKPVVVINPSKAGGAGDIEVKTLQPMIEKLLGQPLVTEYLTTGGGVAAYEKVFNAPADSYQLVYLNAPWASIKELSEDVDYKVMEFTFLQNVSSQYRCLAVLSSNEIKSIDDLVRKAKSGSVTIAHSGIATSGHMQTLLVEKALGIDLTDVPFDGTAPAKAAFLGGHVDVWAIDAVSIAPLVKSGQVRVLAMCAPERHALLPDVKTFKELGYDGVEASNNRGFVASPNLPKEARDGLIKILNAAMNSPEMKAFAEKTGATLNPVSGDEYKAFIGNMHKSIDSIKDLFKQ